MSDPLLPLALELLPSLWDYEPEAAAEIEA
jgi:hypothetical protein